MRAYPALDVVIVNYNGADWNMPCFASLLAQGDLVRQVIVVDNASTDGSFTQLVERYAGDARWVFLPQQTNRLFAAGCNRGMEKALEMGADYIVLLNNDTTVEPECLETLLAFVENTAEVGGVQPLLVRMDAPHLIASAGCRLSRMGGAWDNYAGFAVENAPVQPFAVSGITAGACLWKAAVLRQIGLFDEDFVMYFEDVDLSLRARKAGWELYTVPQAKVRHMGSASTGKAPAGFCVRLCQANALRLLCKHWPGAWLVSDVLLWGVISVLACLANAAAGHWALSVAIGRGIGDGLLYFPAGLWRRWQEGARCNALLKPWIDRKTLVPPAPHA